MRNLLSKDCENQIDWYTVVRFKKYVEQTMNEFFNNFVLLVSSFKYWNDFSLFKNFEKKSSWKRILSFSNYFKKMIVGIILPGQTDSQTFRVLISAWRSSGDIGELRKDFSYCFFKYKCKVLVVFGIFFDKLSSYRTEEFIKVVRNYFIISLMIYIQTYVFYWFFVCDTYNLPYTFP